MWEVKLLDYGIQHDFYSELSNKQFELNMWEVKLLDYGIQHDFYSELSNKQVKLLDSNFQKMIT